MSSVSRIFASNTNNQYIEQRAQPGLAKQVQSSPLATYDRISFSDELCAKIAEQRIALPGVTPFASISSQALTNYMEGSSEEMTMQLLAEQSATHMSAQEADPAFAANRYAAAQSEGKSLDAWVEERKALQNPSRSHPEQLQGNTLEPIDLKTFRMMLCGSESAVTSKQGTVVAVEDVGTPPYLTRITRKDGLQLSLNVTEDLRINDLDDGSLSLYFPSSGKTCIFDPSGAMRVEEGTTGQSGTKGDDIIINVRGSAVDGGDGDDTVFNFADNAAINGGKGDDTVFVNTSSGNSINMGDGNDRLVGKTLNNSHVDMGEGDNVVSLLAFNGGSLQAGDGNNEIVASNISGKIPGNEADAQENSVSVSLGNGKNSIVLSHLSHGAQVQIGDGDNSIYSSSIYEGTSLHVGDGNNSIYSSGIHEGSSLHVGDGNNSIYSSGIYEGSSLHVGDGNNTVSLKNIHDSSSLNIGDGNNYISVYGVSNYSTVNIGDGKNIYSGNTVSTNSNVNLGNGGNTIWLNGGIYGQSSLNSGAGDDIIHVSYVLPGGSVHAGGGNDIVHAESVTGRIFGGDGDDTMIVEGPTYGTVDGDGGRNSISKGKKELDRNKGLLVNSMQALRNAQLAVSRYAAQM